MVSIPKPEKKKDKASAISVRRKAMRTIDATPPLFTIDEKRPELASSPSRTKSPNLSNKAPACRYLAELQIMARSISSSSSAPLSCLLFLQSRPPGVGGHLQGPGESTCS